MEETVCSDISTSGPNVSFPTAFDPVCTQCANLKRRAARDGQEGVRRAEETCDSGRGAMLRSFVLLTFVETVAAQCGEASDVTIDFSSVTNPSVSMEWTDASGTLYTGQTLIPFGASDTSGGSLPGGSIRWRNVGLRNSVLFDLIVTVSTPASYYSDLVAVQYVSPTSSSASQAVFTSAGFACIGFGLRTSTCESGSALTLSTATCADGTPTTQRGEIRHSMHTVHGCPC